MRSLSTYKHFIISCFIIIGFSLFITSCGKGEKSKKKSRKEYHLNDLKRIKDEGALRAVVDYNSTNYFVYRGKPMGFKFEMLQQLANDLDVELEIVVSNDLEETFSGLKTGRFDLIAKNLTITKQRSVEVDFTTPIGQTSQVLVQRQESETDTAAVYVHSTLELAGKKVHVQKNTSYYRRLMNLSEEIGSHIEVLEDTVFGVEQLVARVAKGEIDYTVCDENVAILNQLYYPNLDVSVKVSFPQNIAWAVRKGSDEWRSFMDEWVSNFKVTNKYHILYHKYFKSQRIADRMESDFHSINGGNISRFDDMVKELSVQYNWDWRLVSSIMYHESRFNPEAGSWAGAYGLMQVMPNTAKGLGIENYKDPKQNIKAGLLMLNWIDRQLEENIPDSTQRIKFVLASYNVGLGHVKDAQRLAAKYGKNDSVWDDNVDYFLLNKSSEKYFKDPVSRFGYCRGEEAYNYVEKVLANYNHYLNVVFE